MMESVGYAPPVKRSVLIAGHQTSVSLEPIFWQALEIAAKDLGRPLMEKALGQGGCSPAVASASELRARRPP